VKFTAHCINLDKRPERWQQFTAQRLPFVVNRFSAIEHEHGNIGCTLSHIEVMRKCKPGEYLLIFEDDAELLTGIEPLFEALGQLPERFDVLYLGANIWGADELKLKEKWKTRRHSENLIQIMGAWCLHAYFVGYDFCQRIMNTPIEQIHARRNLDTYIARVIQPEGNCYIVDPLMFIQRMNYSDITQTERKYNMIERYGKAKD